MQHNSAVEPNMWISDGQGQKYLAHGSIPIIKLTLLPHFKELNQACGKALGKWARPEDRENEYKKCMSGETCVFNELKDKR